MNLTEFTGDKKAGTTGDSLDWAEDDWEEQQQKEEEIILAKQGIKWSRHAGSMGDFRSDQAVQLSTVVPEDMVAPFVAHVANLPNSINDDQLQDAFGEQFNVIQVGVVKRQKSTFGYVEVGSREELQSLILQTGRNIGGRKIRCDVATPDQIERFKGSSQSPFNALSRDAIGSEDQPEFRNPMGGRGMRQSGSMGDFSRDGMGEQQGGGFGGLGSTDNLGDFRSQTVAQPDFPKQSGGKWRKDRGDSKPASPNAQQESSDFGGWRDAPKQAQPERKDEKKTWGKKKDASPTDKKASEGGTWRRESPTEKKPAPAEKKSSPTESKPSEPKAERKPFVWGQQPKPTAGGDDRFGALRK